VISIIHLKQSLGIDDGKPPHLEFFLSHHPCVLGNATFSNEPMRARMFRQVHDAVRHSNVGKANSIVVLSAGELPEVIRMKWSLLRVHKILLG
jgi:hypothetical protein